MKAFNYQLLDSSGAILYELPTTAGVQGQALLKTNTTKADWFKVKEVLTQDTTFYVDANNGVDTTARNGRTPATAWKNPYFAIDWIKKNIDQANQVIRLKLADGTYPQAICSSFGSNFAEHVGGAANWYSVMILQNLENWVIEGNIANPNAVVFNVNTNTVFTEGINLRGCKSVIVKGIKLQGGTTTSGTSGIVSVMSQGANIQNCIGADLKSIAFGGYGSRVSFENINVIGDLGNSGTALMSSDNASIGVSNLTVNLSNCAQMLQASFSSKITLQNMVTGSIPANKPKFYVAYHSFGNEFVNRLGSVTGGNGIVDSSTYGLIN